MKTPTPELNIETTFYNIPYLSGRVGSIVDNIYVPEVNAYVYIYLDGFLVNPPSQDPNTNKYDNYLKVLTDENGEWKTLDSISNASLIYIKQGSIVTVKAKGVGKEFSDLTVPYAIQGMTTPIDLGVYGDFGKFRAPYAGEYILYGRLSHWKNAWEKATFLKCGNRILIYSDGYLLGEIQKNKIIGDNKTSQALVELNSYRLSLLVNDNPITVSFNSLNTFAKVIPTVNPTSRYVWTFPVKNRNSSFKVYNNIRMRPGISNDYIIEISDINIATLTFVKYAPEPNDLVVVYEVNSKETLYNTPLTPSTLISEPNVYYLYSVPDVNTLQIFYNGIYLEQNVDYTVSEKAVTFNSELNVSEDTSINLIADYQPILSDTTLIYKPTITQIDALNFSLPLMTSSGTICVYKNGVLQNEETETYPVGSFTITRNINNILLRFNEGKIDTAGGDALSVIYEYAPNYLENLVDYLNTTDEFKNNCLRASIYSRVVSTVSTSNNVVTGDGSNITYTIPTYDFPVSVRLFKNGVRLKETRDYILTDNTITLNTEANSSDIIQSIIQYNTSNLEVNSHYVYRDSTHIDLVHSPLRDVLNNDDTLQIYMDGKRLNLFDEAKYRIYENSIEFVQDTISPSTKFIIDYQPSSASDRLLYVKTFITTPDDVKTTFKYETPTLSYTWNVEIFKNGIKLVNTIDYTLDTIIEDDTTYNVAIFTVPPSTNDVLLIDFYTVEFNAEGINPQFSIESYYPLEPIIPAQTQEELQTYKALFGDKYTLTPGKDTDGEFLYFIKGSTGEWKYSNIDLVTRKIKPFTVGQHLTARAVYNKVG